MRLSPLVLSVLLACGGKSDSGAAGDSAPSTTATATATAGTGTGTGSGTSTSMPPNPAPFTISFGGAVNADITFDTPLCSNYPFPSLVNFRAFWRGSDHNAVLIAEVLSDFAGAGTYDTASHNLRVKLQTEAGTVYSFDPVAVETSQGDSATLVVDHIENVAWGTVDASGMNGAAGAVTMSPQQFPIWCDAVEN